MRRWLSLASVALALALPGVAQAADTLSCTPPGIDLAHPVAAQFTAAQMAQVQQGYVQPEVRGLRTAITGYLAGRADATTAGTLAGIPRDVLRRRFLLLSDDPGTFGGAFLTVQFKGWPERVYDIWVYQLGGSGVWEVRHVAQATCSAQQQRWIQVRYPMLLSLPGG
jgi:hypothetical protein